MSAEQTAEINKWLQSDANEPIEMQYDYDDVNCILTETDVAPQREPDVASQMQPESEPNEAEQRKTTRSKRTGRRNQR